MGCKGSKTKDEDDHPYSDKAPLTVASVKSAENQDHNKNLFENVPYIDASIPATKAIIDDHVQIESLNDDECVVRTSYRNHWVYNNEQTLKRLKDEAFDVVKRKMSEQNDQWEVLKHIQTCNDRHEPGCSREKDDCSCFDRSLMLKLIGLIRDDSGNLKSLDDLGHSLQQQQQNGESNGFEFRLEKCIALLLQYAQSQSDSGSFLRAIGSRLSAAESTTINNNVETPNGLADFMKKTSGNSGITVDCREDENVELIVKKTIIRKTGDTESIKNYLESRGIEFNDDFVNAQEILIETDPPAEIDPELKKRAEILMRVADTVSRPKKTTQTTPNQQSNHEQVSSPESQRNSLGEGSATSAETVLSEVVNELTEAIIKDF